MSPIPLASRFHLSLRQEGRGEQSGDYHNEERCGIEEDEEDAAEARTKLHRKGHYAALGVPHLIASIVGMEDAVSEQAWDKDKAQ